jgi:two-component system NarL family sensor kinase
VVSEPLGDAENRVAEQISSREAQFRSLALAALDNQRNERGRLACRLHDEAAQLLSGAGLQLDILRMDLEDSVPGIAGRTAEIQGLLERVVTQIRELSYELNAGIADRAGLQSALELLAGRCGRSFPGSLRLIYDSSTVVTPATGIAMERIAAEAVANAMRHAGCHQIEVIVKSTRHGATLVVRDNGHGFDAAQERRSPTGLGLLMMGYSATTAGLDLTVAAGSTGTTITAVAPRPK